MIDAKKRYKDIKKDLHLELSENLDDPEVASIIKASLELINMLDCYTKLEDTLIASHNIQDKINFWENYKLNLAICSEDLIYSNKKIKSCSNALDKLMSNINNDF